MGLRELERLACPHVEMRGPWVEGTAGYILIDRPSNFRPSFSVGCFVCEACANRVRELLGELGVANRDHESEGLTVLKGGG
jgi:hypothetical protein